jgi:hypothetical protein
MHKSILKSKYKIKNSNNKLYKTLPNFFHIKSFQQFVKFVNQILKFHVDKQSILNGDVLDGIISVYNHLN